MFEAQQFLTVRNKAFVALALFEPACHLIHFAKNAIMLASTQESDTAALPKWIMDYNYVVANTYSTRCLLGYFSDKSFSVNDIKGRLLLAEPFCY